MAVTCFSLAQKGKTSAKKSTVKKTVGTSKIPKDVQVWTIDAQRAKCEGVMTMQCLLVKKPGDKDFNLFYDTVDGFDYQEGFVYTLWVKAALKASPFPADASMYTYTLVKVVSKKPIAGYANTTVDNKKPLSGMNVSQTKTLVINEEKGQCEGNADTKCLLIKEEGKKEFEIFYQSIEGFVFEEGYRQTISVSERYVANPMVKQTEPIYTLIKVLKKELIFDAKKLSTLVVEPKKPLDKKWVLRKMQESDTTSFEIEDNSVWIQLNSTENKLNGKAPCNSYFGGFNTDMVSSFQAVAVAGSRMYCENNMKYEDLYFTLLQNADRFEIKQGKLILYKGKRLLLIFE